MTAMTQMKCACESCVRCRWKMQFKRMASPIAAKPVQTDIKIVRVVGIAVAAVKKRFVAK